jgi:hypothetical protein
MFAVVPFTAVLDSTRQSLTIHAPWKEDTHYNLILDKQFATDNSGRQLNKTDTLFFTTRKRSEYGSLVLHIRNLDSTQHPVLQIVQNNVVIRTIPFESGEFRDPLFTPGDYDLRIFYDRNKNGKLDPGNYAARRQPEISRPLKDKLTVKANWDNEIEMRF